MGSAAREQHVRASVLFKVVGGEGGIALNVIEGRREHILVPRVLHLAKLLALPCQARVAPDSGQAWP